MITEITVGNKSLKLKSTAGTAIFYKRIFRKDILREITDSSIDDLSVIDACQKLAFIMAMQADGTATTKMLELTEVDYIDWVDQFDSEAFQNVDIVYGILGTWNKTVNTSVPEKN